MSSSTGEQVLAVNCEQCGKLASSRYALLNHIRRVHSKVAYTCYHCDFCTNTKDNLSRHVKIHLKIGEPDNRKRKLYSCPMCARTANRQNMLSHYADAHDISVRPKNMKFDNYDEFLVWKADLEKKDLCNFVVFNGSARSANKISHRFRCSRDGIYLSRGSGKRQFKNPGTCRINAICPASISASHDRNTGVTNITYIDTHVGHTADVDKLNSIDDDIARKIAARLPFEIILDDIKASGMNEFERTHLVTRVDLHNVNQSYHLHQDGASHVSDTVSVESWVNELHDDSNIIRFFKRQGTVSSYHPYLADVDFVLIYATDSQLEMLSKFGRQCVCFDSTHSFNKRGLDLTALLGLDDLHQGYPCGFMVSNRVDPQTISLFVDTLKSFVGEITTNALIFDMTENFFDGWCKAMPTPQHHFINSWFVDREWRSNLRKVSNREKRPFVYKMIRSLHDDTDEQSFPSSLESVCHQLVSDPETRKFGEYFKSNFADNYVSWANCFRKQAGIDTIMALEAMHEIIKHIYAKGKKLKRLDKALHALVLYAKDKLSNTIIDDKLKATKRTHNTVEVPFTSKLGTELYEVKRKKNCCNCEVECVDSGDCIHSFSCNCIESTIKYNICEHIQMVNMFLKGQLDQPSTRIALDSNEGEVHEEESNLSDPIISEDLSVSQSIACDLDEVKKELLDDFKRTLEDVKCQAHVDIVRENIRSLQSEIGSFD